MLSKDAYDIFSQGGEKQIRSSQGRKSVARGSAKRAAEQCEASAVSATKGWDPHAGDPSRTLESRITDLNP